MNRTLIRTPIAPVLDCRPEVFSIVVFVHELAHTYSQLGADIEGKRWPSVLVSGIEVKVKEALTQYYTHKVLKRLRDLYHGQFSADVEAFKKLQEFQSEESNVHKKWIDHDLFIPQEQESIRSAMLQFRRHSCRKWDDLEDYGKKETERLKMNDPR